MDQASENKENEYKEKQLQQRRAAYSLRLLGSVTLAQGAWAVIKSIMSVIDYFSGFFRQFDNTPDEYSFFIRGVIYFIVFVLILAVFSIRFYIGFSARADSSGAGKTPVYIVISCLLAGLYAFSLVMSLLNTGRLSSDPADYFVSLLLDFTSLALFVDLIRSAKTCRRLRRQLQEIRV